MILQKISFLLVLALAIIGLQAQATAPQPQPQPQPVPLIESSPSFTEDKEDELPMMPFGEGVELALHQFDQVTLYAPSSMPEESAPTVVTYSGLLQFRPPCDGTYRVIVWDEAWIDFFEFQETTPLVPSNVIRPYKMLGPFTAVKALDFELSKDRDYVFQVAHGMAEQIGIHIRSSAIYNGCDSYLEAGLNPDDDGQ